MWIGYEEYLDKMIDDEIEKHTEFKRKIRKVKIMKINQENE